jgi:hypothetical protein
MAYIAYALILPWLLDTSFEAENIYKAKFTSSDWHHQKQTSGFPGNVQTENPNKPWMIKQFSLITANSRI